MWPASFWEKYEYFIRKSAGLGKSPTKQDPDMYDHRYLHCDILIVGGGVSGLMAAKIASDDNKKVLLLEDKDLLGGSLIYDDNDISKIDNQKSSEWLKKLIDNIKNDKNIIIKTRTSLAAYYNYNFLLARQNLTDHLSVNDRNNKIRQRLYKIRDKKSNYLHWRYRRPQVFHNNDRPGIMLASAVKKYIDYYGVRCV